MRDRLVPVAVALLCIIAVGLGAASLTGGLAGDGSPPPSTSDADGNDGGSANVEDTGDDVEQGGNEQLLRESDECIAEYRQVEIGWVIAAVAGGLSLLVFVRTRNRVKAAIAFPLIVLPAFFLTVIVFAFLGCPVPGEEAAAAVAEQNVSGEAIDGAFGAEDQSDSLVDRVGLGGILLALVLSAFLLGFYIKRRNSGPREDEEMPEPQATQDAEIAAAAGEAAAEIAEESDSQNGVYRAWARMAEPLDVEHPEASTPGEFADAALAAGLDADNVSELTRLFESVRYGTTPVTSEHEKRARAVLGRIERDYAEESPPDDGEGR